MGFKAGNPGGPGRPAGHTNKVTKTVKEFVLMAFLELQKSEEHNLVSFAKKYPRDFYVIASKLIPTEVNAALQIIPPDVIDYTQLDVETLRKLNRARTQLIEPPADSAGTGE